MNEELYDMNDLPISANAGWQEMHALLNQHLPTKRKMTGTKRLHYVYTALLLTILLFTFLNLDTVSHTFSGTHDSQQSIGFNSPGNSTLLTNKNHPILNRTSVAGSFAAFKRNNPRLHFIGKKTLPARLGNTTNSVTGTAKIIAGCSIEAIRNQVTEITHAPANKIRSIAILSKTKGGRGKIMAKGSWNLFAGIAANASFAGIQNLQPYPVAEIRYHIMPGFYIAAGLSGWSPTPGSTGGISKTTYVYDTVNNISLYNETTTHDHLRYADIPVSLGMNITKNISVQGGIQMSVLLHKRTKKILSPYNFQMTSTSVPIAPPLSALPPNMEQEYDVAIRPVDYRFIAGIRYSRKRTMVGLTYQHSLQPAGRGVHVTKHFNHVLALSVSLRLK